MAARTLKTGIKRLLELGSKSGTVTYEDISLTLPGKATTDDIAQCLQEIEAAGIRVVDAPAPPSPPAPPPLAPVEPTTRAAIQLADEIARIYRGINLSDAQLTDAARSGAAIALERYERFAPMAGNHFRACATDWIKRRIIQRMLERAVEPDEKMRVTHAIRAIELKA